MATNAATTLALTREDMMQIFRCSASKLWRLEKKGLIPQANRTWGAPRWIKTEIEALFDA